MKKDFTSENEKHIISIVKDVTADGFFDKVVDFFGDVGIEISGWFGKLNINNYLGNVDEYHRKIIDKNNTTVSEIRRIFSDVREDDTQFSDIQAGIRSTYCEPLKKYLQELIDSLDVNSGKVDVRSRLQYLQSLRDILQENRTSVNNNPAYSDDYLFYGGKQHGCYERWTNEELDFKNQVREIVDKYYPNYSDAEIQDFLYEMNENGCHYMAVVNTIFGQYIGREDEFEKTFGFPMYDENGHVNSDLLMLDFYMHQHKKDRNHSSLEPNEINNQWSDYLDEKEVNVRVEIIDLDIKNFDEVSENGEIIIVYSPLRLRDSVGNLVDTRSGGHGTVVTDVEYIDGKLMYKVSSWGKEFWIDPDDYADIDGYPIFEQVIYQ